ncbi:rodlin [Streptomyces diacarni]|uniref:RdlA protein n=1 Tax=Streptomyces diacarni TaxID=2800381 RepID=A0A367ENU9_9ACTN|nr:rodlin [Streptomyces diacarni]RCG19643.1 RdlA protein [Streptomyces diacarni]
MMKKALSTATVAVSLVGMSALAAPQAFATGNDTGTTTVNGNGADQSMGNAATYGNGSPQFQAIQGTLNKPCVGLPADVNVGSVVGLVNVAVQDINVLHNPQNQQCSDNSSQAKGDDSLSHILDDISALSANGENNN